VTLLAPQTLFVVKHDNVIGYPSYSAWTCDD
jgi:hypothetical protein